MKYQFNKIFPLSIKEEKSAGKPHFGSDLGRNLDQNFFFEPDLKKWQKT